MAAASAARSSRTCWSGSFATSIDAGEVGVTLIDEIGQHVYQPGFMYIAMGGERAEKLVAAGARPARRGGQLSSAESTGSTSRRAGRDGGRQPIGYDQLVLATGSRIVPEEIEHFDTEAHHFYTAEAALELRHALDAFKGGRIVIGIAGMPYKCPPAPLEVAFLIESELRERGLREKSELHYCTPIGRAFTIESVSEMATPILEREGDRAPHLLQRRGDRSGPQGRAEPRGRGAARTTS